jgi:hypothetical protein
MFLQPDQPQKRWRSPWELDAHLPDHGPIPGKEKRNMRPADEFADIARASNSRRDSYWVFVGLLGCVVLAATLLLWVYTRDGKPEWDGDLMPQPSQTSIRPPGSTPPAAERLLRALTSATPPTGDAPMSTPLVLWSTPALARYVESHSATVDQVRDLIGEKDWDPTHPAWVRTDLGNHPRWTALDYACAVSVIYHSRMKQDAAAVSLALDMLTLARHLGEITGLPTYYARALELHRMGCMTLASALQTSQLSATDLTNAQIDTEKLSLPWRVLRDAFLDFYRYEKGLLVGPLSQNPVDQIIAGLMKERPGHFFFKPNDTLSLFAASFREMRDEVMKPPYSRTDQITPRVGPRGMPRALPGHRNYSGIQHANQRIWSYVYLMDQHSLAQARHELVRLMFCIRRYMALNGKVPPDLNDLVREGLVEALPRDPFSGESFRYDPVARLIYSVGENRLDEGGRAGGAPLEDGKEPSISLIPPS